jgi:arylsulfatase A-like enzyme
MKKIPEFIALSLMLGGLLLLSGAYSPKKDKNKKNRVPNIVLIMADDLGYSDLSCYGSENIKTPVLDKLASEGIRFTDYHSNGAVCSPTRAALMTGKYQQRTGIEGVITAANHRDKGLAPEETTIAEALKSRGYVTGMYGKWHLGYAEKFNPVKQGFDVFRGFVSGNIDYFSHVDQEGYFDWWDNSKLKDDPGYSTDLITKYGIAFMKKNSKEPFFLYLPYEAPHYPFQARYSRPFRKVGQKQSKDKTLPADSIPTIYKDMVETLDASIGKILATLKELGLDDNTLVFFCSDNGGIKRYGKHNAPLRGHKGTLYEGGHRVPAIARWPGKIPEGKWCDETILSMDILPTLVDITGGTPPEGIDGVSFKKVLVGNGKMPERSLFWRFRGSKVIRKGDMKLIVAKPKDKSRKPEVELYNLKSDISESDTLADGEPEKVNELQKELDEWDKEVSNK